MTESAIKTAGAPGHRPSTEASSESTAASEATAPAGDPTTMRRDAVQEQENQDAQEEEWLTADPVITTDELVVAYAGRPAVIDVTLAVPRHKVTAIIGPSGCGKSTLLRCFNRMNDFIEGVTIGGRILFEGADIHARSVDPVELRRRIGMVFQKPNPFPKSIYDNIAWGPRVSGYAGDFDELVERSLREAALWDEVEDKLEDSGLSLSGGQQQRLCIARALAMSPEVILMDEPCSALDPIATGRIEELMKEIQSEFTIVIVTHNMQQAARVSDRTAFFTAEVDEATGQRRGKLIELDGTGTIFSNPADERTEAYVTGRFG